jgi:hypothetical protein
MTDKVQKIREEVEKIAKSINPFLPDEDGKNSEYEAGRFAMVTQIMQIIDSLQEEPVSEDLGEYLYELSKQFPEVSFAKLSRIAVRVAKWQKEQMMSKAIDFIIVDNNAVSTEISTFPYVSLGTEGDTVKLIIINQD